MEGVDSTGYILPHLRLISFPFFKLFQLCMGVTFY